MLSFSHEQNEEFVIFGIASKRLAEVRNLVWNLPHKYLIGSWKGQVEASCLMPLKDFRPLADEIGKGEQFFLRLGPFDIKKGSRPASLVSFEPGKGPTKVGNFSRVPEPLIDEDFTFDPETGFFYTVSES